MLPIKFSICIPNYNYEKYLGETIQSVLEQTYPDLEIVVMDNASTDRSIELVRSFKDTRIRLFSNQSNVGFAPNLDRAAANASNPFVIMLSSDDLMRPTALEEYARLLKILGPNAENVLLVSSIDLINGQGVLIGRRDRQTYYQLEPEQTLTSLFNDPQIEGFRGLKVFKAAYPRMSVPGHFCTTLFSKKLYDRVGGYSSIHPIGPDAHLAYKILLLDAPVIFVNRPLFAYRIHSENQVGKSRGSKTLKVPINTYLFSIEYSDDDLAHANVKRDEIVNFLVNNTCILGALEEMRLGSSYQAFRYLMFALSSAPGKTLRNPKAYGVALLLSLGFFGPSAARLLHRIYKYFIPEKSFAI